MSSRPRRWSQPEQTVLAAGTAGGLFLLSFGLVHLWFWRHGQLVDTPTYRRYGDAIVHHGRVPYRAFAVEYPPGALPMFMLPSLAGDYATIFAWLMAACGVALVAVVATVRPAAAFFVALSPLLIGSLVLSRFDLWPALLATAALAALASDRHRLAWGLLGAAVSAKLWPLALVPLAVAWSVRRGRGGACWVGALVLVAVFLPFAVAGPHGLWSSVHGEASRPMQVESLGAALLTTFAHPQIVSSHGSQNIAGHDTLAALIVAAQTFALVALWLAFARGPMTRERLLRYAAAAVCGTIALSKVLSPQFLIWLVPLVPLVRGKRGAAATALLTAALVLTQVWFPQRYFQYATHFRLAGLVLARDLVLVGLLAVLAWPARAARS